MARKRPPNKVHTSPERAGEQNMENVKMAKDELGIMGNLVDIMKKGKENEQAYKGLWTAEQLADSISEYFAYCYDRDFKPTLPSLTVWLGVSRQTMWAWRNDPVRGGDKRYILDQAMLLMESYLQSNIDKYPTGSIFLLKTTHGHAETQNIVVKGETDEDVAERIKQLGLKDGE